MWPLKNTIYTEFAIKKCLYCKTLTRDSFCPKSFYPGKKLTSLYNTNRFTFKIKIRCNSINSKFKILKLKSQIKLNIIPNIEYPINILLTSTITLYHLLLKFLAFNFISDQLYSNIWDAHAVFFVNI